MRYAAAITIIFALLATGCGDNDQPGQDASTDTMVDTSQDSLVFECSGFTWPVEKKPVPITQDGSWVNRIGPTSPRLVSSASANWVKFHIFLEEPDKVYYQDGNVDAFHYDFASQHLDPFKGKTLQEYEAMTLAASGQKAAIGTLLFSSVTSAVGPTEYAVLFERQDAMHPELVRALYDSVVASLDLPVARQGYYFPTFAQKDAADAGAQCFQMWGIEVAGPERWQSGDACYANGWAFGRLKFVEGNAIDQAYAAGDLLPTDILLTNATPAEVPFVAGIVSLTPSTPNSHVAILAQTFNVPFVHVRSRTSAELLAMDGREVVVRARPHFGGCQVRVVDVEGKVDSATRAALLAHKQPPVLDIPAKMVKNADHLGLDALTSADAIYVGGKAANFGYLRRAIPDSSPMGVALTFDVWDAFMSQPMAGHTLGQEIDSRLAGLTYPQDIAAIKTALSGVRTLIIDQATFTAAQTQAIGDAITAGGFAHDVRLRFRSSTNVEDADQFTGAGLYSSFSGCFADDTDGDSTGPSQCDASKSKEKSALKAIRKVFASFYNDNAYLERRRLNLDETKVGMGILIHRSFPDPQELANGVVTLLYQNHSGSESIELEVVSQKGAVSVTNPVGGATPEHVRMVDYSATGANFSINPVAFSSLVPVGAYVMEHEADYLALAALLVAAFNEYKLDHNIGDRIMLDFEFKKVSVFEGVPTPQGKLVVKQIRRVPLPETTASLTPILLGDGVTLCTRQAEAGDVWANHRLKAELVAEPQVMELTPTNRQQSLFASVDLTVYDPVGATQSLTGAPSGFPAASHTVAPTSTDDMISDRFEQGAGPSLRTVSLRALVPQLVTQEQTPILLLEDLSTSMHASYTTPVPMLDQIGVFSTRSEDVALLWDVCGAAVKKDEPKVQIEAIDQNITIRPTYWWADLGDPFLKTAPLGLWDKTEILGLISQTITLRGFYSQSNRPGHHNFGEQYIFEPRAEPGIAPAIVSALNAIDVAAIWVNWSSSSSTFGFIGLDGQAREQL